MASNSLNECIDFDDICGEAKYNIEEIESLPVDVRFCAEFAAMQEDNSMSHTVTSDDYSEEIREDLAAMSLYEFKSMFRSSSQYAKILGFRRKEQKRINTQFHRLKDKRESLAREKLQLQREISYYASMLYKCKESVSMPNAL